MAKRPHTTSLPAPYLKRIKFLAERAPKERPYPFNLTWLKEEFELHFTQPVTIIVGENGTGKSTFVEAVASLAGYDEAGGGRGYNPVNHENAHDISAADLAWALRGSWLPKLTTGWFFRAETFFDVARYLDAVQMNKPDYLSHSHGEGFLRLFQERMNRQGVYFMDEPESALSPRRQLELLRLLARIQEEATAQVIMATHSPILMGIPGASLLEVSRGGFREVTFEEVSHFRLYRAFCEDPQGFIASAIAGDEDMLF